MEVNQNEFRAELREILKHASNASYVTFDLEMSGIHQHSRFSPGARGHDNGKPSIQELYDDTKIAAETYQVLQMGITFIEEDREKEYYLARPYNFNLSPLLYQDNKIKDRFPERRIVFSSCTSDFLQGEGFDFGKVFREGVYYLSHAEEEETRRRFEQRNSRDITRADAVIPPSDTDALEFYRNARKTIADWVNDEKPKYEWVNIGEQNIALNGFQRLLVHQLVKSEFPGYRSFARNRQSFIQVEKIDPKKEARKAREEQDKFNLAVARQIGEICSSKRELELTSKGLRWIFEALTGGDLSGIPTTWFTDIYENDPEYTLQVKEGIEQEFEETKMKLKTKDHFIIGHNLFMDLVCLYKTFVGTLPSRVEDFQERIGVLFPTVIDTKYLATHNTGTMDPIVTKNLSDLLDPFKKIQTPLILLHENHSAYSTSLGKNHEAGFDSWMTAELFVKLSAKLYAENRPLEKTNGKENGHLCRTETMDKQRARTYSTSSDSESSEGAEIHYSRDGELLIEFSPVNEARSSDLHRPAEWHSRELQRLNINENDKEKFSTLDEQLSTRSIPVQWLPANNNLFWKAYLNRLRVNAVSGGVIPLGWSYPSEAF